MSTHAKETQTVPYWSDSASMPRFPKLGRNLTAVVVVVGGGITGLTAASLLTAAGRSVVEYGAANILNQWNFSNVFLRHAAWRWFNRRAFFDRRQYRCMRPMP